jgi:hypothetical protein
MAAPNQGSDKSSFRRMTVWAAPTARPVPIGNSTAGATPAREIKNASQPISRVASPASSIASAS